MKEIVIEYLKKHYKDVLENEVKTISDNMFSYVDKKHNKHIIRVLNRSNYIENADVKTCKIGNYVLELVTIRGKDGNTSNSNSK